MIHTPVFLNSQSLCFLFFWYDYPGGSEGKVSACNAGDPGSIPGSERSPGGGNGHPLQYSCLENPIDRHEFRIYFFKTIN